LAGDFHKGLNLLKGVRAHGGVGSGGGFVSSEKSDGFSKIDDLSLWVVALKVNPFALIYMQQHHLSKGLYPCFAL
jgi:hypothetical protein